ncbi:MAG: ABC transporter permease [Acidimicrobiales bacterium]
MTTQMTTQALNTTYYRLELRRIARDKVTLFFTVGLPAIMYVIFGASPDYGDDAVREGNVAMWIMIAMAAYGAVSATTGIGGAAAIERMQGWTRQLGLTPLRPSQFVAVKAATAMTVAAGPIAIVYAVGAATGASAPWHVWVLSAIVLVLGAMTFALYGLSFGLAFRSEAAVSAAAGALVIMSFFGNIFIPLAGWQLTVAKFTPLYGYVSLARRSLTGGATIDPDTGDLIPEPLWQVLLNVSLWTAAFATITILLVKNSRGRQ